MRRMAESVAKAEGERGRWVYQQTVRANLVRSNGELSRREKREYVVAPGAERTGKTLVAFEGEYRRGGKMYPYSEPGFKYQDRDIDGALINNLVKDLVDNKKSRDGIPHNLFPLRAEDTDGYTFRLVGEGEHLGRHLYKVAFEPADKEKAWRGEAWVDAEEFQPVRMTTEYAHVIPWAVRAFLGTSVRQMGFSVTYARVAENVWFPVTYGTEFKVSVLFGYKRTIALSLESAEFRRAEANSRITFDLVP